MPTTYDYAYLANAVYQNDDREKGGFNFSGVTEGTVLGKGDYQNDSLSTNFTVLNEIHTSESLDAFFVQDNTTHQYGFVWRGTQEGKDAMDDGGMALRITPNQMYEAHRVPSNP